MKKVGFNIAVVERDVGLSKDVLRVWERRYGFPAPERDANGERVYSAEQVERLRLIKRLMDQGHRPGRLLTATAKELKALTPRRTATTLPGPHEGLDELVDLIKRHAVEGYSRALLQRLARQGLQSFVQDTVVPLMELIGLAWAEGRLQVHEEHLFAELTARVLRQAIATLPAGREPCVVMTTLPNEQHGMGLLLAEAMLSLEGARCVPLGLQTPMQEVVHAAVAHQADIVALSFSTAFPKRQISGLLWQLRDALPAKIELWAGGSGMRGVVAQDGAFAFIALQDAVAAIARWRSSRAPGQAAVAR